MVSISNSILINPFLIKEMFNTYTDSSSFANYENISHDYNKLYNKIFTKFEKYSKEEVRKKVNHWFFNQSLENRIKLCTVENEFVCQMIYKMYLLTEYDKTLKFSMKNELIDVYELNDINKNTKKENDIEKYFKLDSEKKKSSYVNSYNINEGQMYFDNDCDEEDNNDKLYNANLDEFIHGIKFYSVHHKPYPDCFCLSQYLLLQEVKFDSTFKNYGNTDYFGSLIQPYHNEEKKIYSYYLPSWLSNSEALSISQYIFAFIEQTIMVKYILNNFILNNNKKNKEKNIKKENSFFSLINDDNLNKIFSERKEIINYINNNYNDINLKKKMIDDAKIELILKSIQNNNKIMNNISNSQNSNKGYEKPIFTKSFSRFNINDIYAVRNNIDSFLNKNPGEKNNYLIRKIKGKINEIIQRNDNIIFIDYLWFQNFKELWKVDYFVYNELIEYIINKCSEQNYNDLIKEETPIKKKRRKKKKKNQNNENTENNNNNIDKNLLEKAENDQNNKNNEIDLFKIESDCYNELFKEKEKLFYIPYYFSVDIELKNKYNKIKENKLKLIELKNKKQDIKEIYNYIKKEFLLKYIIDKVIQLKNCDYSTLLDNDNKEKNNEIKETEEINNLKLINQKQNNISLNNSDNLEVLIEDPKNENRITKEEETIIDNKNNDSTNEIIINNEEKKVKMNSIGKKEKSIIINIINISEKNETNDSEIKSENNEKNTNIDININSIKDKIKINSNSSHKNGKKKREKSPNIFFLFDTIKNKNKRKPKSKSPNNLKTEKNNHFALSFIPSNNKSSKINKDYHLYFIEKLHNNILNNDKKVDNILQPLISIKNYCIEEIKKIIKSTYDNIINEYNINLYGSFITGLMIEASDIDIRIKINECNKNDFEKYFLSLSNELKNVNKFENITPISTASVPVIKLLINIEKFICGIKDLEKDFMKMKQLNLFKNYLFDKKELLQTKIDITFIINDNDNYNKKNELCNNNKIDKLIISMNNNNELSSVLYIKEQMEEYPEIKPILRLLKRYFYTKKMNSSFEGGLSSYNLFLLILSFAKYQKIFNLNKNKAINLGIFLVQFLEFFGKFFDFQNYLININSPYIYELINYNVYKSGKSLIILDPLTGINASKSSYKIDEIQKMFLNAFDFFEKERIIYENEYFKEKRDKKDNNNETTILGLTKIHKNDNFKKNKKDKICTNIIDKFFFA